MCDGQNPISGYVPPSCDHSRCGTCFQVTNQGGIGGDASGVGQSIIVQIIDACPATNAGNFCKTSIADPRLKCMDPGTNSLDIEQNAYTGLTGQAYASVCSFKLTEPWKSHTNQKIGVDSKSEHRDNTSPLPIIAALSCGQL